MLLSSSRRKYLREDACVIRANDDLHFPKLLFAKELCNKIGKQKSLPNQFLSVDRYIARIFNIFAEIWNIIFMDHIYRLRINIRGNLCRFLQVKSVTEDPFLGNIYTGSLVPRISFY